MDSFNATATNHRGKIASLDEPSIFITNFTIFRQLLDHLVVLMRSPGKHFLSRKRIQIDGHTSLVSQEYETAVCMLGRCPAKGVA